MKSSYYNHFFRYDGDNHVAYNALTNALALIENEKFELFNSFCKNEEALPEKLEEELKIGGFIIDDFIDELKTIEFRMLKARYNTEHYALTLVPSNDCNFRCDYCYQKDVFVERYMTQKVQDKLVDILESKIKSIRSFSVCWFGGEPLLAFDIVESLSNRFIKICKDNDVTYFSNMVTNGYLLTKYIIKRLNDVNCSSLQITIDGNPDIHNKRRPLASGDATYETIINNLKNGCDFSEHSYNYALHTSD